MPGTNYTWDTKEEGDTKGLKRRENKATPRLGS
jgi:hypothetical protein